MLNYQRRVFSRAAIAAIDQLMRTENIQRPTKNESIHITLSRSSSPEAAMQYTWRYVGNGTPSYLTTPIDQRGPMYRIHNYIQALNASSSRDANIVQVDIGSGPGTFTWALLDWIRSVENLPRANVHILAYDHCPAINQVAINILNSATAVLARNDIRVDVDGSDCLIEWPGELAPTSVLVELFDDLEELSAAVQRQRMSPAHHLVTLGYVLANNHDEGILGNISNVISGTAVSAQGQRTTVIASDTSNTNTNQGRAAVLSPAWDCLVGRLRQTGLWVGQARSRSTHTKLVDVAIGG